ncbi:MAG TPA: SDR family NAD(P)-dependent oxidoreductase [Streptosporangiaceae bacterium]|nr:SDR family NAD(P)-dependent oxidoreductase [Streptosporangiaceae bacterium]
MLRPQPGGPAVYTIVAHFATGPDMDGWQSSQARARLVAEADAHSAGGLATRYLSGLEGWLAPPGAPMIVTPAGPVENRGDLAGRDRAAAGGGQLPARPAAGGPAGLGPAADLRGGGHPADAVRGHARLDPGRTRFPLPGAARRRAVTGPAISLGVKTALVTAAATGIGTAIAADLAAAGARVVINHLATPELADTAVGEIEAGGGTALAIAPSPPTSAAGRSTGPWWTGWWPSTGGGTSW